MSRVERDPERGRAAAAKLKALGAKRISSRQPSRVTAIRSGSRSRLPPSRRQVTHSATSTIGAGKRVQVEFVSANPTGPLTSATAAAPRSARSRRCCRPPATTSSRSTTSTTRARRSRSSAAPLRPLPAALRREVEIPADGYPGEYVIDLAKEIANEFGDAYLRPHGRGADRASWALGIEIMVDRIRDDLAPLGVDYDVWFCERSLYEPSGTATTARIETLRDQGYVVEREGAVWFTSSELGEEKDNVLVRSTGLPTYFASDIAYHYDKFITRGFDRVIDIWGADHQGHVSRVKTAVAGARRRRRRGSRSCSTSSSASSAAARSCGSRSAPARSSRCARSSTRSAPTPRASSSSRAPPTPDGVRPRPREAAERREPGLLRPVRPRPHRRHPHEGARRRLSRRRRAMPSLLTHPAELALIRKMLQLPGAGRVDGERSRSRTTCRTTRRSWRPRSTCSTRSAA